MRVLRFIERNTVGVLRAALPHDVQVAVERGTELPGISVEFRITGTSQRTGLADLFMFTNELYLPELRSFEAVPAQGSERRRLLDQLTIELVRHAVAEEQHLYPAVREHVPGEDALADKEIDDHSRVEQLLKDLEGMDGDDPELIHLFVKLRTEVHAHVEDEESNLFVQLRAACGPEILDLLGQEVRMAKETAPTRPHPGAPSSPLASKILSPGLGLVDRVRDFITGRGE